jgi:hypothetical protein
LAELKAHFDVTNDILIVLSKGARSLDPLKEIEGVGSITVIDLNRALLRMKIKRIRIESFTEPSSSSSDRELKSGVFLQFPRVLTRST